jgi:hypothetical protein
MADGSAGGAGWIWIDGLYIEKWSSSPLRLG